MQNNYQNIDADLDEGKKCCGCFGLELGYNILGALSLINAIYFAYDFFNIISIGFHLVTVVLGILWVWYILYGLVWLSSFLARRSGNS